MSSLSALWSADIKAPANSGAGTVHLFDRIVMSVAKGPMVDDVGNTLGTVVLILIATLIGTQNFPLEKQR